MTLSYVLLHNVLWNVKILSWYTTITSLWYITINSSCTSLWFMVWHYGLWYCTMNHGLGLWITMWHRHSLYGSRHGTIAHGMVLWFMVWYYGSWYGTIIHGMAHNCSWNSTTVHGIALWLMARQYVPWYETVIWQI